MKVLMFNSLYYPNIVGGAERSVQILAEGLLKKKIVPVIVTTSDRNFIDYVNGVKVYYIRIPNLYWMKFSKEQPRWKKPFWHLIDMCNPFLNNRTMMTIFLEEKPDIIHTNNLSGFSVIVWKLAKNLRLPVVHTIRDYYLLCPSSTMFRKGKNCKTQCNLCKLYSAIKKLFSNKYVNGVVGVSKFILNKHLNLGYFQDSKVKTYIYNPISFINSKNPKKKTKKEIVLGLIGTMSPAKGTEFVLEIFKKINFSNIKIFVYGRGINKEYERSLKKNYSSKNIVFKGFKKTEEMYEEIDILIIPSLWHEPFSRVLIEAYSYGIPVLASNRGGIPENIIEQKTGLIFNPDKEGDFEEKLIQLLKIYRSGVFDPNFLKNFARNKFSEEAIVSQYIDVYQDLLYN